MRRGIVFIEHHDVVFVMDQLMESCYQFDVVDKNNIMYEYVLK